jgi:hypothetical protein
MTVTHGPIAMPLVLVLGTTIFVQAAHADHIMLHLDVAHHIFNYNILERKVHVQL